MGMGATTVRRWVSSAERRETADEKKLAKTAMEIAQSIKEREAEVRQALLDRMVALASECEDDIQKLATAYGILTDKANVAAGRPSSVFGRSPDERDAEIERLLAEEAAKRGWQHDASGLGE